MGQRPPHTVAAIIASLFSLWVIALWIWPDAPLDKEQEKIPPKPKEVITEAHMSAPVQKAITLQLPAPPAPAPVKAPASAPKPALVAITAPKEAPKEAAPKEPLSLEKEDAPKAVSMPQEPAPKEEILEASQQQSAQGRVLLKVLEHGKGPVIEIAWPAPAQERERLYQVFQSCYGMKTALISTDGDLFRKEDPRSERWEINLDRYSGFIRHAAGQLPKEEQNRLKDISRHHRGLGSATPVRVFPRNVDAQLLGALSHMIGSTYQDSRTIQARYVLKGLKVSVEQVTVDGHRLGGGIILGPIRSCTGRV